MPDDGDAAADQDSASQTVLDSHKVEGGSAFYRTLEVEIRSLGSSSDLCRSANFLEEAAAPAAAAPAAPAPPAAPAALSSPLSLLVRRASFARSRRK